MNTNKLAGSPGGGNYQNYGVGNSDNAFMEATKKPEAPHASPESSQGEIAGAGSIYAAMLNERPNVSNNRNRGPERAPSKAASSSLPIVKAADRSTGKIG